MAFFLQVLVVSVKNWRVDVPQNPDELHESTKKRERIPHTNQFRQVSLNVLLQIFHVLCCQIINNLRC